MAAVRDTGRWRARLAGPLDLERLPGEPQPLDERVTGRGRRRQPAPRRVARGIGAQHPRQGQIIDVIIQVLTDHDKPMQARAVEAEVEALLREPVRWASVKALLTSNVARGIASDSCGWLGAATASFRGRSAEAGMSANAGPVQGSTEIGPPGRAK